MIKNRSLNHIWKFAIVLILIAVVCVLSYPAKNNKVVVQLISPAPTSPPAGSPSMSSGLAKSAWPKFHADIGGTGQGIGGGTKGTIKWQVHVPYLGSVPAIGTDGTVYLGEAWS